MQVDWFTVAAEIINFLILVAILKYFLYDRIVGVAEAREEEITSRFKEVEAREQEAAKEAQQYRQQRQEFEAQRETLLEEVKEEADARRRELMDAARTAVEEQQQEWYAALERERKRFLQRLHQGAGKQIYTLGRRALADLADADLEQQVIATFLDRLRGIDSEEREEILTLLEESNAEIRTAFPLPEASRQEIIATLQDQFNQHLSPQFSTDRELICGVALRVNGHKITWNLNNYLDRLEEEVRRTLEEALRYQDQLVGQSNGINKPSASPPDGKQIAEENQNAAKPRETEETKR